MATLKTHKVVAALPDPLEADSIYFVRVGAGFDLHVTNSAGLVVSYSLNAPAVLANANAEAFVAGKPTAGEEVARLAVSDAFTLPAGLTGSRGSAGVAATASAVFSLKKNGTEFGTATFAAAGTTATFAAASATSFAAGDVLTIVAPATADSTLADIALTLDGAGSAGVGVPAGGTTGQVLTKTSEADHAIGWSDPSGVGSLPPGALVGAPMAFRPAAGLYLSNILTGTLTAIAMAAGRQEVAPFVPSHDFTIDQIGLSVSTALAGSACGLIFDADADGRPTTLLAQAAAIDTGSVGTKFGACPFTFEAGRLYWVGWWTSAACQLRCPQPYSALVLSWTNAATPVRQAALRRTVTFGGTSTGWTYASGQHTSTAAPFLLFRVA